ncbi:hypothetical protein GLOTRDRAFT_112391 [Gloeophyllum trabeum ATCC 11539]|uniref:LysM domain-containing protein n=1 Tax=Gloeophyllum trabeum (strain ATCC 11539 / FP-39264 / Madison 617) TaxID=670483 RepID=S7RG67_GLOTA|nr:uncharacterized protein GLOTRDRAFT_112391 [Gloeophyllum trabeum ATCC 11539]EPQ51499.1 hypothetical protein GLOTRDRAFT_112391 [Gloeophyllum trabeum ATCC 11539]
MFSQTVVALIAVLPFAAQVMAADCARSYTIQEGDICDSISAAQNVSTYQLAAVNTDKIDATCSNLNPGDTLCLGYPGEDCTTTYVVQPDDSCDAVQAAHGMNSTILLANNPQLDEACSNLYIGEVLCVAPTVQAPAAPSGAVLHGASIPATATAAAVEAAPTDDIDDEDLPWCEDL